MSIAYTTENSFQTPLDRHNQRVDSKEWIHHLPKLYIVSIEDHQYICDFASIKSKLEYEHGGHCKYFCRDRDGIISIRWIDNIDNELAGWATAASVDLFGR